MEGVNNIQKMSMRTESTQNNEENCSNFLTYFNMLLFLVIMFNILATMIAGESLEDGNDGDRKTIFLPARSTSVFMWGGVSALNWPVLLLP